jgi:DNA repair ATPase RecN
MDQASARQASVAALQGEVRALYELTGRARQDARVVTDAQPELARARTELDGVLTRLNQTDGLLRTLEERRRQADRVEERLARAGVLQEEVRSALETLLAQKAQVDHYIEKTASLSLETRQAEGLLQALRDERRLSDRVRAALAELRPGQPESEEEDPE